LEKGLAQWAFYLIFQLMAYSLLTLTKPKRAMLPFFLVIPLFYYFFVGFAFYETNFLHEPARLTALVSGACIIFLCLDKRGFVVAF
jgi:hypothetical protein